jgi:hypothetical protein
LYSFNEAYSINYYWLCDKKWDLFKFISLLSFYFIVKSVFEFFRLAGFPFKQFYSKTYLNSNDTFSNLNSKAARTEFWKFFDNA